MQLAGDPRSLLGNGDTCRRLAFTLGMYRPLFRRVGLSHSCTQGKPGEPRDREDGRDEDEVTAGAVGVVVDHDRRADHGDRQTDAAATASPRLPSKNAAAIPAT